MKKAALSGRQREVRSLNNSERQKQNWAIARQVARLLAESQATCADLPEIFRLVESQLIFRVQPEADEPPGIKAETRYAVCQQCGKAWHHEDAAFCSGCGKKLELGGASEP